MNNFFMTDQSKRLFELDKSKRRKDVIFFALMGVIFLSIMIVI